MPGQPVNVEIPADDTAQAREFYGSLFGWQFEASQGLFEYDTSRVSDHSSVAITNMEPGKRGIRVYFDVDDIDASTARVKELGGVADQPRPVPGRGWTAVCRDGGGNEFGLWQDDPAAPGPTY
jgi:predicted enzyme related to lactoylglutathione lyase